MEGIISKKCTKPNDEGGYAFDEAIRHKIVKMADDVIDKFGQEFECNNMKYFLSILEERARQDLNNKAKNLMDERHSLIDRLNRVDELLTKINNAKMKFL